MRLFVFDVEVFTFDWLIVFKEVKTGEYTVFHNHNHGVKEFMRPADILLAGFNNKHYDNHILTAILCGADNTLVKDINDHIIGGAVGWNHWFIRENRAWFQTFDLMDDMQMGLSLKAIEGHLGLPIVESSVPFDIDRPLTEDELTETVRYCKYDTDMVEELIRLRKDYLNGKIAVGRMKGVPMHRALYATNAKLTALFLGAKQVPRSDERNYRYPDNLNRDRIPKEVFEFFNRMHDPELSDDEVFKSKLEFQLQDMTCVIGYGGIHGALPNYMEVSEE
jgi:hypothetical protein